HGICTELAMEQGVALSEALEKFNIALEQARFVVGQNIGFDINIMGCEFHRMGMTTRLTEMAVLDTCTETTAALVKIPGGRGGKYKLPTLTELHQHLFGVPFTEAHNATADVEATTRCFLELVKRNVFSAEELQVDAGYFVEFRNRYPDPIKPIGLSHVNLKAASDEIRRRLKDDQGERLSKQAIEANKRNMAQVDFVHLHNHTQFSVLQSTISVDDLVKAAAAHNMPAVAITDHGNMMGAFQFVARVFNHNKAAEAKNKAALENGETPKEVVIKPIVG